MQVMSAYLSENCRTGRHVCAGCISCRCHPRWLRRELEDAHDRACGRYGMPEDFRARVQAARDQATAERVA
jgi:hypothetical protein